MLGKVSSLIVTCAWKFKNPYLLFLGAPHRAMRLECGYVGFENLQCHVDTTVEGHLYHP